MSGRQRRLPIRPYIAVDLGAFNKHGTVLMLLRQTSSTRQAVALVATRIVAPAGRDEGLDGFRAATAVDSPDDSTGGCRHRVTRGWAIVPVSRPTTVDC